MDKMETALDDIMNLLDSSFTREECLTILSVSAATYIVNSVLGGSVEDKNKVAFTEMSIIASGEMFNAANNQALEHVKEVVGGN